VVKPLSFKLRMVQEISKSCKTAWIEKLE
jgi:hypothetical protein